MKEVTRHSRLVYLTSMVLAAALLLAACGGLLAARPEAAWDHSPDTVIFKATYCCGFSPQIVYQNALPDATIWGDGRIVWVQQSEDGGRQVFEGHLSDEQLQGLIEQAISAGFFGWEERYADNSVTDMADQCLTINLEETEKMVCEYYQGAPVAFHDLYDQLASGAGAQGQPFVPERGYVITTQLDPGQPVEDAMTWDAEALGVSLADASEGLWMEGPALQQAWQVANAQSWGGQLVQESDHYYQVAVQLPGLSLYEVEAQ